VTAPRKQSPSRSHRKAGHVLLTVWVRPEERDAYDAAAKAEERDRSTWIRLTCNRAVHACSCGHHHVAGEDGEDGGCGTCDCGTWKPRRAERSGRTTP
jgi:hypothetical protein